MAAQLRKPTANFAGAGDNMFNPNFGAGVTGDQAQARNPGQSGPELAGALPSAPPIVSPPIVPQNGPMSPEGRPDMGAFDPRQQVGHDGTINGMNREQYRDAWMGSGAASMDDLNKFISAHGGTVTGANGAVQTPFGEQLDMLFNAKGSAAGNGPARASWGGMDGGAPSLGQNPNGGLTSALRSATSPAQSISSNYSGGAGGPADAANPGVDPFAAMGGGTYVNGGWIPNNNPGAIAAAQAQAAANPVAKRTPTAGPVATPPVPETLGAASPASTGGAGTDTRSQIDKVLQGMLSGGLNQDIINSRTDQARGVLDKQRKSSVDTLNAQMADRGQSAADGTYASGSAQLDRGLNDDFANQVQGIFADESANADQRMMQGLTTGANLSIADAQNLIDKFNAQTGRQNADTNVLNANNNFDLGKEQNANTRYGIDTGARTAADTNATNRYGIDVNANVAHERNGIDELLGKMGIGVQNRQIDTTQTGQQLQNNQFLASLGLDRDKLTHDMQSGDVDQLIQLLQQQYGGAQTGAGGYV